MSRDWYEYLKRNHIKYYRCSAFRRYASISMQKFHVLLHRKRFMGTIQNYYMFETKSWGYTLVMMGICR